MSMVKDAVISECGKYRYLLLRHWGDCMLPVLTWIMLNPSTADATIDDPTIRRCISFSKAWGYGGLHVVNLFALRATDPRELLQTIDPVGPENDKYVLMACRDTNIVAAWGNHGMLLYRDIAVKHLLKGRSLLSLGETKNRNPKHPLYLSEKTTLIPYPASPEEK